MFVGKNIKCKLRVNLKTIVESKNRRMRFIHIFMSKSASKIFTDDDVDESQMFIFRFNGCFQVSIIYVVFTIYFTCLKDVRVIWR